MLNDERGPLGVGFTRGHKPAVWGALHPWTKTVRMNRKWGQKWVRAGTKNRVLVPVV